MNIINFAKKHRNLFFAVMDILIICIAYFMVHFFKAENIFTLSEYSLMVTTNSIVLSIAVYESFLMLYGVYKNITRYESGKDYIVYGFICLISSTVVSVLGNIFNIPIMGPRSTLLAGLIIAVAMITYRVFARTILTKEFVYRNKKIEGQKNLLIIGGGSAAKEIIKIIQRTMIKDYKIVGIIDDNVNKHDYIISGIRILGGRNIIQQVCKEKNVQMIFFSITNISSKNRKEILDICQHTGAKIRILPSTEDLIRNKNLMDNLRDVEIEDLLGREPVVLDNDNIRPLINDKTILVTGGGGSIGSELCRQIITYKPKTLVILDIYENSLYDIEQELKRYNKDVEIKAVVASIRDKERLNEIFEEFKPYLVFHAAAHKHVPLMEASPLEAIRNNVFGTYNVVNCCDEYNVKRFILISTDKAVNPTNIMGATKRICEMIVQAKDKVSNTEYVAVRFGNVLGSNGSVVPLFKKQIKDGGPVTVTHKDITRYFMTIPEAAQLVIQAMTYAKGGEIFVLDMGEPVKIYDLAVSLIKLSGLEPNVDIKIEVTGLRPGEKLYEELLMSEEGLTATQNKKIHIAKPMNITMKDITEKLNKLEQLNYKTNYDIKNIKNIMKQVVPTYKEQCIGEYNENVK